MVVEYYIEETEKKLIRDIEDNMARIKLWERVERVHKKDGSDFQNLIKNFTNISIRKYPYGTYISVSDRMFDRWISDEMKLEESADEVEERIKTYIASYKKNIEKEQRAIKVLKKNQKKIEEISKFVGSFYDIDDMTTYYAIKEVIKKVL